MEEESRGRLSEGRQTMSGAEILSDAKWAGVRETRGAVVKVAVFLLKGQLPGLLRHFLRHFLTRRGIEQVLSRWCLRSIGMGWVRLTRVLVREEASGRRETEELRAWVRYAEE